MKINYNSTNIRCYLFDNFNLFLFELQHQALVLLDIPGEIIVQINVDYVIILVHSASSK